MSPYLVIQATATAEPVQIWQLLVSMLLSGLTGALTVLVAFRTRLALMDRRIEARKTEIVELEKQLASRLDAWDRRQTLILQIVADVARKVGADSRLSDTVLRFLADEVSIPRRDDASTGGTES